MNRLFLFHTLFVAWITVTSVGFGTPPNVVMIIADDLSYRDLGFMGNEVVHTPNIDQLAARSARYPNGYVPMSVCRPSLATLLTGLYPHQHGIHFNHPPPGLKAMRRMTAADYHRTRATTDRLIKDVRTLPRSLAEAGYACLQTGKHWEGDYKTAGFTHGMTIAQATDRIESVTGTRLQENGEAVAHGNGDAGLVIGRETMQPIRTFIEEFAGKQPFFVWYAPFLPHTPFDAPKKFRDLYNGKDVEDHLLPYFAEIARFDRTVGQLLGMLTEKNLLADTLIVFVSDNGFRPHRTKHERYDDRSKLSVYEDGLRTPILICWEGKTQAFDHPQLVQTVDLAPTILSAVGLRAPSSEEMPGIDLMPSARAETTLPDRAAFGAVYPNDAEVLGDPARHVRAKWIRKHSYKLILPGPSEKRIARQLYDLQSDPMERENLSFDPEFQPIVRQLTEELNAWWPTQ